MVSRNSVKEPVLTHYGISFFSLKVAKQASQSLPAMHQGDSLPFCRSSSLDIQDAISIRIVNTVNIRLSSLIFTGFQCLAELLLDVSDFFRFCHFF